MPPQLYPRFPRLDAPWFDQLPGAVQNTLRDLSSGMLGTLHDDCSTFDERVEAHHIGNMTAALLDSLYNSGMVWQWRAGRPLADLRSGMPTPTPDRNTLGRAIQTDRFGQPVSIVISGAGAMVVTALLAALRAIEDDMFIHISSNRVIPNQPISQGEE